MPVQLSLLYKSPHSKEPSVAFYIIGILSIMYASKMLVLSTAIAHSISTVLPTYFLKIDLIGSLDITQAVTATTTTNGATVRGHSLAFALPSWSFLVLDGVVFIFRGLDASSSDTTRSAPGVNPLRGAGSELVEPSGSFFRELNHSSALAHT